MSAIFPLYPTVHPVQIVKRPADKGDPTVYEYRGARITAWQSACRLDLKGHPYGGVSAFRNPDLCLKLIDHWLAEKAVPAPYVWPPSVG
jgi:hypothetical protein